MRKDSTLQPGKNADLCEFKITFRNGYGGGERRSGGALVCASNGLDRIKAEGEYNSTQPLKHAISSKE
jgi:hypothetical protein